MSDLYNRIEILCNRKKVNVTTMCKESGASRASLTDLKVGRKQGLSTDTLSKIASYFGVSVDYLLGNEPKEKPAGQTTDEPNEKILKFVEILRELPEDKLDLVIEMSKALRGEK